MDKEDTIKKKQREVKVKETICTRRRASYPENVRIYPLDLSTCHFVATKIGPIRCPADEFNYENLSKYFILMDKENRVTLETNPFETVQYIREIPILSSAKKTASGVRLRWAREPYALGYCVYRKTGNGKYQKLVTIKDISQTTFVDKNAGKGGRYSYFIKTFTTNGKQKIYTQKSNVKSVTR